MRTLSFSSLGSWYFASTRHGGSLSWCILGELTSFRTNVKRIGSSALLVSRVTHGEVRGTC
jgi:hypothetical protein